MDGEEFRIRGKEVIDYMVDFKNSTRDRRVFPDVHPGYLKPLLPSEAPTKPDKFEDIMEDFETKIVKGVSKLVFVFFFSVSNMCVAICLSW